MRVSGLHNKKKMLQILIDRVSTHNFLDLELAKELFECKLDSITTIIVIVEGGTKLKASYICKGFMWQLQQSG